MYKKIDEKDIAYLSSLFDEKYFFVKDNIPEDYYKDELGTLVRKPDVLIFVHSAEEISKVMTYANEHYPEITDEFQSILKCVYPVIDQAGQLNCNNKFARKHTVWVENFLLENSPIIKSAVDDGRLYIAKCHFDHNTGEVYMIDSDLHKVG